MTLSALKQLAVVSLFAVICFCIYSNTFYVPFQFDDELRIQNNAHIRLTKLGFSEIVKVAFGRDSQINRPVGNISFALNYYFHQYDLKGYHLVNIIIHFLTGVFLFFFHSGNTDYFRLFTRRFLTDVLFRFPGMDGQPGQHTVGNLRGPAVKQHGCHVLHALFLVVCERADFSAAVCHTK